MFTQIKTSLKNKETVTVLTRKFGLGAENIIARIAIAYSLQSGAHFSPLEIKDSGFLETSSQYTQQLCANIIVFECRIKTFPVILSFI